MESRGGDDDKDDDADADADIREVERLQALKKALFKDAVCRECGEAAWYSVRTMVNSVFESGVERSAGCIKGAVQTPPPWLVLLCMRRQHY